jgi:hypothetical protein
MMATPPDGRFGGKADIEFAAKDVRLLPILLKKAVVAAGLDR